MNASGSSYVDPTSLSLPSPPPETSTNKRSASPSNTDDYVEDEPSRKRQRSGRTIEDRKEARMHRNRIAAQNSRDKRKAQFSYLEKRVSELEEENRRLRADMDVSELPKVEYVKVEDREREKARERENEELKERIKTLEKGWEAVVKALAAQGLPTGVPALSTSPSDLEPKSDNSSSQSPTSTFPVFVPPSPIFPLSPISSQATGGEYRPNFDIPAAGEVHTNQLNIDFEPTSPSAISLFNQYPGTSSSPILDETVMEDFLREILADSPSMSSTNVPPYDPSSTTNTSTTTIQCPAFSSLTSVMASTASTTTTPVMAQAVIGNEDWEREEEMQRLLDMLPSVPSDGISEGVDFSSALNMELCGWDMEGVLEPSSSSQVGVF